MIDTGQENIARKVRHLLQRRELDSATLLRHVGRRLADLEAENCRLKNEVTTLKRQRTEGFIASMEAELQAEGCRFAPVSDEDGA